MEKRAPKRALEGLVAIAITPFRPPDGREVDAAALRRHLTALVSAGIRTIVVGGNTGEFYSLTPEECSRIVHEAVAAVGASATVLGGVGHDVETAVALAKEAEAAGAHGVMVHNPVNPYLMGDGVLAYYRRIADAVSIGVVPYVRHPNIDARTLAAIAAHPNVIACKYAVNDLQQFAALVEAIPPAETGMAWLCGTAESWAPFFAAAGATGFTSGLVNVVPRKALEMEAALGRADFPAAMRVWADVRPFEALRARHASALNVSVVKAAMALLGTDSGIVRPPIAPLGESERQEVAAILRRWGLLPETRLQAAAGSGG